MPRTVKEWEELQTRPTYAVKASTIPNAGLGLFMADWAYIRKTPVGRPLHPNVHRPFVREGAAARTHRVANERDLQRYRLETRNTNVRKQYTMCCDICHWSEDGARIAPVSHVLVDADTLQLCQVFYDGTPTQVFDPDLVRVELRDGTRLALDFTHEGWYRNQQRAAQGDAYLPGLGTWVACEETVEEMRANDPKADRAHPFDAEYNAEFVPLLTPTAGGRWAATNMALRLLRDVPPGAEIFVNYGWTRKEGNREWLQSQRAAWRIPNTYPLRCIADVHDFEGALRMGEDGQASWSGEGYNSWRNGSGGRGCACAKKHQGVESRMQLLLGDEWVRPVITLRTRFGARTFEYQGRNFRTPHVAHAQGTLSESAEALAARCTRLWLRDVNQVLHMLKTVVDVAADGVHVRLDDTDDYTLQRVIHWIDHKSKQRPKRARQSLQEQVSPNKNAAADSFSMQECLDLFKDDDLAPPPKSPRRGALAQRDAHFEPMARGGLDQPDGADMVLDAPAIEMCDHVALLEVADGLIAGV
jgi:hypothetical protein